jgi:hypothetical protein
MPVESLDASQSRQAILKMLNSPTPGSLESTRYAFQAAKDELSPTHVER